VRSRAISLFFLLIAIAISVGAQRFLNSCCMRKPDSRVASHVDIGADDHNHARRRKRATQT
jgi:hypothetical protein